MTKEDKKEFLKNDSKYSSMRLAFMRTVNAAIALSVFIVVGTVVGSIIALFVPDSRFSVDLGGLALVVGPMFGLAFAGKTASKFSPNEMPDNFQPEKETK
jgi:hypothetical protein